MKEEKTEIKEPDGLEKGKEKGNPLTTSLLTKNFLFQMDS